MGAISESDDLVNEIKGKTILHWNYRGLTKLPDAIRTCAGEIIEIYLKDNKITNFPNWTSELVNLTHLYLHGNSLKNVPAELAKMKNLTLLDLSENGLDELPCCIGELEALEFLTIDNNYIKKLPPELQKLKNLRSLSISNNEFVAIPEWLGSYKKLEQIRADENMLEELPNRLTLAPELGVISVCSNRSMLSLREKLFWRLDVVSPQFLYRLSYLPLNGFASCPSIYFRFNPYLNYLSYPVFRQLLSTVGSAGIALGQSQTAKKRYNVKNLQISVDCDNEGGNFVVELPRQLLNVHGVDVCEPVRLWELALRRIYCQSESTMYKEDRVSLGVSYNLLTNGPIATCGNENCKEPIFTEAWLIAATCQQDYDSTKNVPVVVLYCSQNCARNRDSLSDGLENLRWQLVVHR